MIKLVTVTALAGWRARPGRGPYQSLHEPKHSARPRMNPTYTADMLGIVANRETTTLLKVEVLL